MAENLTQAFQQLHKVGAFVGLSDDVVARMRQIARLRTLINGEPLYCRGDIDRNVYALTKGTVISWLPGVDGVDRPIHVLQPGFWITSAFAHMGEPRLVTNMASGPATVVCILGPDFDALLQDEPSLWQWLARLTARNHGMALEVIRGLLADGAGQRVASRLLAMTLGVDWIELTQDSLARLTGLSRNSVQRALARLEQEGLISTGYRRLTVVDREGLERFATNAGATKT